MSWDLDVVGSEGILQITAHGVMDAGKVRQMAAEAVASGLNHGLNRVLVDSRDMTLEMTTLAIYNLPKTLMELGLERTDRVAHVVSPNGPGNRDLEFYETVSRNRGLQVRLFSDQDAALDWLRGR